MRARDHRGLDGDLQAEGDRRRTRLRAGAQRRMAAGRLSCLARGMGEPGSPRAWSAGWQAQGEKVDPPPLRQRRSRRSRPLARSSHRRPHASRARSARGNMANITARTRCRAPGEKKKKLQRTQGGYRIGPRRKENPHAPELAGGGPGRLLHRGCREHLGRG
jgi:hypothetical protein